MIRSWIWLGVLIGGFMVPVESAFGQFGGTTARPETMQAGSAASLSGSQGYGLNSRFGGSNFDTFMSGSSALGTTTAGARAGTSGFGQDGTAGNARNAGGFGNLGLGGFGGMRGFGGQGGVGGNRAAQGQQAARNNKVIRTRMTLGFKQPTRSANRLSSSYENLVRRVLARDDYADGTVNLVMEGETAVLKGTVGSSHVRDVAERLALLEPGIAAVRNELTLRAAEPKPET